MSVDINKLSLSRVLNKAREIFTPIAQRNIPLVQSMNMASRAVNTPLNVNLEPFRGAYNSVNRALKQPASQFGQSIINTSNKLVNSPLGIPGRAVMGYGDSLRENITRAGQAYEQNTQLLNEGAPLRARIKPLAMGGWNTAKALAQVTPIGALKPTVGMALPGLLNAGIAKYQGQDPARAFGRGVGEYQGWRPILNVTDPAISKVASKLSAGGRGLSRLGKLSPQQLVTSQVATRGATGIGNVIEDEILARLDQRKITNKDRAFSFGLGAAMGGNEELLKQIDFNDIGKKLGVTAKQVEEVYNGSLGRKITVTDNNGKTSVGITDKQGSGEWIKWATDNGYDYKIELTGGSLGSVGGGQKPPDPLEALKAEATKVKTGQDLAADALKSVGQDPNDAYLSRQQLQSKYKIPEEKQLQNEIADISKRIEKLSNNWNSTREGSVTKMMLDKLFGEYTTKVNRLQEISAQSQLPKSGVTGKIATPELLKQIETEQLGESQLSRQGKEAIKQAVESETGALSVSGQGKPSNPSNPSLKVSVPKKKYSFNINKNKLSLGKKEQEVLDGAIGVIKPELEKAKGKTLSNKEVIESAKKSEILQKITTREETLNANAAMLKARQRIVELDKDITKLSNGGDPKVLEAKMRELVESLRVVSAEAADRGRKLQSLSIQAEDESLRQSMLKEIGKVETDSEKIIKEAANVDWNDAKSVATFYRKFIKPSTTEILDEFRYNNMLSNPRTHIRNAYSNLLQTFVTRPLTIAATGDIKGATQYYRGALSSFPDAIRAFTDSFSGKTPIDKPDMEQIPTLKLPSFLTIPSRAMEAGDKFFTTLIRSGELAKGSTTKQADDIASYSLFRQNTHPEGQGKLLEAIDNATDGVYQLGKKIPLMRWFVPFIRTPMNFAKQWVEYSPLGVATLPRASNKKEQLAKAFLGTTVTALGAYLATEGRTTWAAPTDRKEKDLFYASGRKPFSIKIGDKWVSMMYAGPFAMALALPAAAKYYSDESKTSLTDSQLEKLVKITSSMGEFLSGQTFLEGLGNFVSLVKGDADYTLPKNIAYTAQQFIPLQGMVRYITTIIDPVYRKSSGMVEEVQKNIPFVSKELEPYTTPSGSESTREPVNYLSPYDITTSQPQYDPMIEQRQYINKLNNNKNFLKKQVAAGNFDTQVSAPDSVGGMYDLDMIDARITAKDPSLTGDEIATYYESRVTQPKSTSAYESAVYENDIWKQVSNINSRESLTQSQKDEASMSLLSKIGVTPEDYKYHVVAKQDNDIKSLYAEEEITKLMASGVSREEIDQWLVDNRKEVDGKQVLTSGVIDYLVDQNILSYSQGKELKSIKVSGSGAKKSVTRKSSKAKKPKKISFKAIKPPKVKIVKSVASSYFKAPKIKRVRIKKAKKLKFR